MILWYICQMFTLIIWFAVNTVITRLHWRQEWGYMYEFIPGDFSVPCVAKGTPTSMPWIGMNLFMVRGRSSHAQHAQRCLQHQIVYKFMWKANMAKAMSALVVGDLSHLHKGQDMLKSVLYNCEICFAQRLGFVQSVNVIMLVWFKDQLWIVFVSYNIYLTIYSVLIVLTTNFALW